MCLPEIFSLITKLQDVVYAIYLLIPNKCWNLYVSYGNSLLLVYLKVLPFFITFLFFHYNLKNNFKFALCFSLLFTLKSMSRQRWLFWLTYFYHFASFWNLLFYQNFANKMRIFVLIFIATVDNIKSHLKFYSIIIYPTETFWRSPYGICIDKPVYFFWGITWATGNIHCFQW